MVAFYNVRVVMKLYFPDFMHVSARVLFMKVKKCMVKPTDCLISHVAMY